ncbi:MAG: hypothetical protein WB586_29200, partial [Chthoniobacterales bacterium]
MLISNAADEDWELLMSFFPSDWRGSTSAKDQRLMIDWALGTIMVIGPKALDFYDDFSNHCATLVKPDGKDILSVTMHLRSEADAEADAEAIIPEITD